MNALISNLLQNKLHTRLKQTVHAMKIRRTYAPEHTQGKWNAFPLGIASAAEDERRLNLDGKVLRCYYSLGRSGMNGFVSLFIYKIIFTSPRFALAFLAERMRRGRVCAQRRDKGIRRCADCNEHDDESGALGRRGFDVIRNMQRIFDLLRRMPSPTPPSAPTFSLSKETGCNQGWK